MMRKVAAHRIVLPDGEVLGKEVVTLDERGHVVEHHSLTGEEPGVEWYCGTYEILADRGLNPDGDCGRESRRGMKTARRQL